MLAPEPDTSKTETGAELLKRAAKLNYAIAGDVVIDAQGCIEARREFHYLSARCDLERRAQQLTAVR